MTTDYKVKLEIFEGPLDLLLYLIKRDELDIYDISIERITGQYLEYLQAFKELNIDVAGEFIVMAANLLYIKNRRLLPGEPQTPAQGAARSGRGRSALGTDPAVDRIQKVQGSRRAIARSRARPGKYFRARRNLHPGERAPTTFGRGGNFSADQRL